MKSNSIFNNNAPLYLIIRQDLLSRLDNEEYLPGDILPTEVELASYYNVSRPTVRQAILGFIF